MDSNDQNMDGTLKVLRDAFKDATTPASGQSDNQCVQAVRGLCEKAGSVLYLLIEHGSVNPNGLPHHLRDEPTMLQVVVEENHDPPEHEVEITVDDIYWWAFVGWAGQESNIPVILTERFTREVFNAYRPGDNLDPHSHRFWFESRDVSHLCRASVLALDYLLAYVKEESPATGGQHPNYTLDNIPVLDKNNHEWVTQKDAAKITGMTVSSLSSRRYEGQKATDDLSGIDPSRRVWRKESKKHQVVWYLRSTLCRD